MLVSSRTVRLVGPAFVVVAALAAAGCGTSLNGLACAEVVRQMRVPQSILHQLSVC